MRQVSAAQQLGRGVHQLTRGPRSHIHYYHKYSPWNASGERFLVMEFEPGRPEARIQSLDLQTGSSRLIGSTRHWNEHTGADQHWLGETGDVVYRGSVDPETNQPVMHVVSPDGAARSVNVANGFDGKLPAPLVAHALVPDDPGRSGVLLLDARGGSPRMLCSIQQAVATLANPDSVRGLHLFTKMDRIHDRLDWLLFNLTNGMQDPAGAKVSNLFVVQLSSGRLIHVGPIVHHPMLHPVELTTICFADDEEGRRRITVDRIAPDGGVSRRFLPYFSKTGHPTFDPTGRFVLVDNYDKEPGYIVVEILDTSTGEVHSIARCRRRAYGPDGKPLPEQPEVRTDSPEAFYRQNYVDRAFRIQAHPAWDRTGRFVAFNSDATGTAQVYLADLAEYGLARGDAE